MINLLPTKEKEILLVEQTTKLAMIWGIIVLSGIVCLIFVLLAIYFYALGEIKSQSFYLQEAQRSYQSPDSATFKSVIQKYNKILPTVSSFYNDEKSFSEALNTIYAISRQEGVLFSSLSLDTTKQDTNKRGIVVSIIGTSVTRENLIFFQSNLLKEKTIENVFFSPESWINPQNTNFNVTFNLIEK